MKLKNIKRMLSGRLTPPAVPVTDSAGCVGLALPAMKVLCLLRFQQELL